MTDTLFKAAHASNRAPFVEDSNLSVVVPPPMARAGRTARGTFPGAAPALPAITNS